MFIDESVSEEKLKIGEHLAKLQARTRSFRALSPSFSSVLAKRISIHSQTHQ